jgi:histone-lysine N-methyltransferase SETMAR
LPVQADNARPLTAKKVIEFIAGNGMEKAPHPPYSLDLAPCDFYLFGYIKDRLAGASFDGPDRLLQAIDAIFQSIEKPHRNARFTSGWTDWRNMVRIKWQ